MFLYSQVPASLAQWHPIEPEELGPGGNRAETDPNGTDFRLLYERPPGPDARQEFIPLFVDPNHGADAGEDAAVKESPMRVDAPEETGSPDLKSDPKAIDESAYQEGFSEGEKNGFAAGKRNADEIVERMQGLLHQMEGIWDQLVSIHEEKILQLVFKVSERLVCGSMAVDPETAKRVILDAFRMIPEPVEVTIELHPEDAGYVERVKEAFFEENKGLKSISLVPDPSVNRGGCRLKTRSGEVDATLETRLDAVRQAVMNVHRNKGDHGRNR